jgi:HD-like signal output (HDOD) protein
MSAVASPELSEQDISALLRGIRIPSPPQVIADLQMEMAMPDPDLNAMAKLIAADVGLSGGVLKIANSPLYGGRGKITSITRAVMVLGMDAVVSIVNALCLRNAMLAQDKMPDALFAAMIRFWDTTTDVAQACLLVAQKLRLPEPDRYYLVGLFHNVGIPLLMQKFANYPEIMRASYAQPAPRIVDTENRSLDTNHAVLGFYTARAWKLSPVMCDVIAQHHNPWILQDHGDSEASQLLRVLKIGEHIAGLHRVLGDEAADREWESVADDVLVGLGLSRYDLEDIIEQGRELGLGQQQYFF